MKRFLAVAALLTLAGCAPNTIKGTDKAYDVVININQNSGYVHLESPLKVDSASETTQDANPSTVISPETALAMPSGGSTASIAAQAATQSLKDVASKLVNDLSKKNSENPVTNQAAPVAPIVKPVSNEDNEDMPEASTGTNTDSDDLAYAKKTSYDSYGKRNGDRYAWRINRKGTEFGQPIKLVFKPSGKTFTVADTSKNCRDREDTCNRDKSAEMYGFVFKPGIGPNGDGDANTGTSHGGVYLQGPYGLADQEVDIYYNGK